MPDDVIDEILEDSRTVGGSPGSLNNPNIPALPGEQVVIRGSALQQYVSGGQLQWYLNYARALPWSIDDVSRDFGSDIYERMLLDTQLRSVTNVLKSSVLEEGITLSPAIDRKEQDGYQQATDLVDDAEAMLEDMDVSIDAALWDLLDAPSLGNKVAEQVYRLDTTPSGAERYQLATLAVKARETVAFVVDGYMNVLGVLGRVPGQPFGVQQGTLLADIAHTGNLLPRSKFAIFSFRPKNGDPRGVSILRPCFDPWNQKQQLKKEWLKFLTQFASPSLIGFTPEQAQSYPLRAADGSFQLGADGQPLVMTPEELMTTALQSFANGTATAFPFGAAVQPIEMSADGQAFLRAFDYLDRQMTKAILLQTLATEEGEHQTRASSGQHKDLMDSAIREIKRPVARMIRRDILYTWIRLNYGESMLPLCPLVMLGGSEEEDRPELWTAVAALRRSDYLHASQFAELDRQVGLPERDVPTGSTAPVAETVQIKSAGVIGPDIGGDEADPGDAADFAEKRPIATTPDGYKGAEQLESAFAQIMSDLSQKPHPRTKNDGRSAGQ